MTARAPAAPSLPLRAYASASPPISHPFYLELPKLAGANVALGLVKYQQNGSHHPIFMSSATRINNTGSQDIEIDYDAVLKLIGKRDEVDARLKNFRINQAITQTALDKDGVIASHLQSLHSHFQVQRSSSRHVGRFYIQPQRQDSFSILFENAQQLCRPTRSEGGQWIDQSTHVDFVIKDNGGDKALVLIRDKYGAFPPIEFSIPLRLYIAYHGEGSDGQVSKPVRREDLSLIWQADLLGRTNNQDYCAKLHALGQAGKYRIRKVSRKPSTAWSGTTIPSAIHNVPFTFVLIPSIVSLPHQSTFSRPRSTSVDSQRGRAASRGRSSASPASQVEPGPSDLLLRTGNVQHIGNAPVSCKRSDDSVENVFLLAGSERIQLTYDSVLKLIERYRPDKPEAKDWQRQLLTSYRLVPIKAGGWILHARADSQSTLLANVIRLTETVTSLNAVSKYGRRADWSIFAIDKNTSYEKTFRPNSTSIRVLVKDRTGAFDKSPFRLQGDRQLATLGKLTTTFQPLEKTTSYDDVLRVLHLLRDNGVFEIRRRKAASGTSNEYGFSVSMTFTTDSLARMVGASATGSRRSLTPQRGSGSQAPQIRTEYSVLRGGAGEKRSLSRTRDPGLRASPPADANASRARSTDGRPVSYPYAYSSPPRTHAAGSTPANLQVPFAGSGMRRPQSVGPPAQYVGPSNLGRLDYQSSPVPTAPMYPQQQQVRATSADAQRNMYNPYYQQFTQQSNPPQAQSQGPPFYGYGSRPQHAQRTSTYTGSNTLQPQRGRPGRQPSPPYAQIAESIAPGRPFKLPSISDITNRF